MMFEDRSRDR